MSSTKHHGLDSPRAELHHDTTEYGETTEWLDGLDPEATAADNIEDLARIGETALALAHNEQMLEDAIRLAREHGRTWTEIALRLGVSRQAARQRYGIRTG